MEVITKTDLHCQGCVDKISPIFNESDKVENWEVDLNSPEATLKVQGDGISLQQINAMLNQVGYKALNASQSGFWNDKNAWGRAGFNTLNCLIGCSIGDFGMLIYLQAFYPGTPLMTQMVLAIIAGLTTSIMLETTILRIREKFNWSLALKTAFGMSFISMIAMEIAMNATDFMITGGQAAFNTIGYWLALVPAMIAGFLVPLPYNYYKLKKFNKACH